MHTSCFYLIDFTDDTLLQYTVTVCYGVRINPEQNSVISHFVCLIGCLFVKVNTVSIFFNIFFIDFFLILYLYYSVNATVLVILININFVHL